MIATAIPNMRVRMLGVGTGVALLLAALVFALTRGGTREPEHASAVARSALPESPVPVASPASVSTTVGPALGPLPEPVPSPATTPSVTTQAPTPAQRPPLAGPRPSRAASAPTKRATKDSVFDSRE
jgi:hypothetical protein